MQKLFLLNDFCAERKSEVTLFQVLYLHVLLMLYSVGGICSKMAAGENFPSMRFFLFYGGLLIVLGIYAIGWQQAIKRIPLSVAFSNKAVTLLWGLFWGHLFFEEVITIGKLLGAIFIMLGIVLFSAGDTGESGNE